MAVTSVKVPAQSIVVQGPDYYVRVRKPGYYVLIRPRPPLTNDEAAAYVDSGSEAAWRSNLNRYRQIINNELSPSLGGPS